MKLEVSIDIVDEFKDNRDTIARVYYPNEGNRIEIIKGLNKVALSEAIFHEIAHLIDWYISNENQSSNVKIRERNADIIELSLSNHFKKFPEKGL